VLFPPKHFILTYPSVATQQKAVAATANHFDVTGAALIDVEYSVSFKLLVDVFRVANSIKNLVLVAHFSFAAK